MNEKGRKIVGKLLSSRENWCRVLQRDHRAYTQWSLCSTHFRYL